MTGTPEARRLWQRVERLFPDLVSLPASRRRAFLDRHCRDAPALRAELESLLGVAQATSPLDRPLTRNPLLPAAELAPESAHTLLAGSRLGAWRIRHFLGRGGMGEVYLAERVEGGFEQQAALKILRRDAAAHSGRFEAERNILAQLQHPHIAQLLDGGIGSDGSAWMAMEHVVGESLDQYCRARQLGVHARLALFDQICGAVTYAHGQLVVHRDLKPGNILVTAQGWVKLLDFGVAKLLEGPDSGAPQDLLCTPDHAAPEQLEGGPITTAVDVYALGVLLHELLSGCRPVAHGRTPISQVANLLSRPEPVPPSRAAGSGEVAPVPAATLKGDLDAIVLRCLRKVPGERYVTVDALRADLRCWRERRPVAARQGGLSYQVQRWLSRNRIAAAATLAVLLALVGGLGLALWQADRAQSQAERAERVKNLVLGAFREQDPLSRPDSQGRSARQLIASGIASADRELANDPQLRAEVLDDFGEIQANLGDLGGARETLQRALRMRLHSYGEDSMAVVETTRKLASVDLRETRMDSALAASGKALASLRRLQLLDSPEAARLKLIEAQVLINRNQRERALQLENEAANTLQAVYGADNPEVAEARNHAAQALVQLRRDSEAEEVARDAIGRLERSQGLQSPRLIPPLMTLAEALKQIHRNDDADAVYQRAIALARRWLAPGHPMLGVLLARQGNLRVHQGRHNEALVLLAEAQQLLPGDSTERGNLLSSLGQVHFSLGHYVDAEHALHQAFEWRRQHLGENAGITWYSASLWGSALCELGRVDEAEKIQREALRKLDGILGPDAYQNVLLQDELVATLSALGKHAEAVSLARRSLQLTRKYQPPAHPVVVERLLRLAVALAHMPGTAARIEAAGDCDAAVKVYGTGSEVRYAKGLLTCAGMRAGRHDNAGARALLRLALGLMHDRASGDPDLLQARTLLAQVGGDREAVP